MVDCSDVYISFDRRENTVRYSFVSHLSAAFHRRGLSSFIQGDQKNGFSKVAIENSRACLVVFSEKYSSSKQCLDELLIISERRRNDDVAVVPVFYSVTKSFAKKQISNLAHSGSEWRNALLETIDLPGHESSYPHQTDSEFVQEIVADVREKLSITENIGTYPKLLTIENLLQTQPWGVRSLGLWGMPGIGKTTLAKTIFDQFSCDYEATCFVKDFNKEFDDKGLYSLLEEHFGNIVREELGISSSITRPVLLRNVLRDKRILVILDDVRKPLDAELFLGGFDWFCPGSLTIITSRDKQVFSLLRVDQIYEVPSLNEEESWRLFSRCAFQKDTKPEPLSKLSTKVIDYTNGNPLALIFLGRELRKDLKDMESAFSTLKQSPPSEIDDAIKSTYDSLSSNDKNIFLDIVCLFKGENIDCVMHLLEGCGFFPRVGINLLVDNCLVSILGGKVLMHNLIQDIGRKIINGGNRRSRLWEPSSIKYFLKDGRVLGSEDIEIIYLDSPVLNFNVNPMAFEHMYNLRYLKICSSKPGNRPALHLPKGLNSLPDELRLLHWENFPVLSLPQDFDTRNLVVLNLCYSKLERLWGGTKELEMLKVIKLCHSKQLVDIEQLQNARNIEVIDLQGCTKLQRFPSISHFQRLRVLNLSGCIKIKSFPEVPINIEELYLKQTGIRTIPTVTLSSQDNSLIYDHGDHKFLSRKDLSTRQSQSVMVYLEYLKVLGLSHCLELEDIHCFPKNLRKLYLGGTSIQELSSVVHLSKLVVLDLENCKYLQQLPMGMSNMNSLEVLNLSGCSELEDILGIPRNLKELYLAGTAIQQVSSSMKHLSELVILDLQNCKRLQHLPVEISKLKSLFKIKLSDPIIQNATSELRTNHLLLTYNENVDQHQEDLPLPRLPSSSLLGLVPRFYALVSLSLYNASLIQIPEEICFLPSLTVLDLGRNSFNTIPESIKQLSKLHSLRLRHCRNLISLPELPQSLKLLNLHGCVSLESVSWGFEQVTSHYTFNNCFNKPPKLARKRVEKGLAKVSSIGKEDQQELLKALAFSICAPPAANETSSYNLRAGSFATIELTPFLGKTLLGFAIFIVVTFWDGSHKNAGLGVRCISTWKTKKETSHKVEKFYRCWAPREAPEVQRDHMFVFYENAKMHQGCGEGNNPSISADHVEFEFQAVNGRNKALGGNCIVTECDVSVITAATGAASLSVISASKDTSLSEKHSLKLSSLLGKLHFRRTGRFVGCVC